nr:protein METHYLENE BLUE SENSITIVITY 1-like [Ipomoea batatas]
MTGKAKPKKHTAKEIAAKVDAATTNRGGGKAGLADRSGQDKGGHAKLECPLCKVTAPDIKSMQIHHDARHPKSQKVNRKPPSSPSSPSDCFAIAFANYIRIRVLKVLIMNNLDPDVTDCLRWSCNDDDDLLVVVTCSGIITTAVVFVIVMNIKRIHWRDHPIASQQQDFQQNI